ncbi:dihydrolipoyl dehydrogenase family protein [Teichococcus aestuarii]|uniref:Dihydrolipoamide dehydrogenase n=1 Tax=Teichococcus aestuarii TaxID=568898 RepID=A0A2U1UY20_9PROT|nr:FAD-dependent oxidoreductase [Pseudoroseomonas aestuarii]PWC26553.1 dihydrolipoamide dehydrogenase [Pseudoroseomonas aestuarii]
MDDPQASRGRRPESRGGVLHTDLCVLGAGSAGLSVAAGAAQMGAAVVLVEPNLMGGDCLNTGCVPSKSLLAAAHAAQAMREAGRFGIRPHEPVVDAARLHAHVHGVIAAIAPHDSVKRFEGLGVTVLRAAGRFTGPDEVEAGGTRVRARRFVVATGSSAAMPPIPGLTDGPVLTNETIFGLAEIPSHLAILGGGPIGVEMAVAFRRLGSAVTLVQHGTILPRDEPEAVAILRAALRREGVALLEHARATSVEHHAGGVRLWLEGAGAVQATHLLVAAGRRANTAGLGLETAGIATHERGIRVDAGLRTGNRRVFAIGDVAGGPQFTHVAGYHAGIVIRRALFGLPARVDYAALPWVTYVDPELAHVGLTEAAARDAGHAVTVLAEPLAGNDRAQAERTTEGLIKAVLGRRGRVLGVTIVAPRAGEMIALWGLAIQKRLGIGAIAASLPPYPTMGEISKRAAGGHYTPRLYGERARRLVGLVQRWLP